VLTHVAIDWRAFQDGPDAAAFQALEGLTWSSGMAARDGLQVFYVLDPLSRDRVQIDPALPVELGRRFADEPVRRAFKHCAMRLARDYHPPYLALASEINTYFKSHPDDAEPFLSLYRETAEAVKQISPATRVTATLQYELLTGTFDGIPRWDGLERFGDALDVVAITTYPSPFFSGPDAIPADYYLQLSRHSTKPVLVAESGWPTGGGASFHGSTANQERFLRRFVELTAGLKLELWIWWFLHDWEGKGYPAFFQTMGLRTSKGAAKPSWQTWTAMVAR